MTDALRVLRRDRPRPEPPELVDEEMPARFVPDPDFARWIQDVFVSAAGPLANEDHAHLLDARIRVLWTNVILQRRQRSVIATAEIPQTIGDAWKRGRAEQQLKDWFEEALDFLLTFSGPECGRLDDRAFCAVVEHELYHCAQKVDAWGDPVFDRDTGRPVFAIQGHDSEEFVGVVRRYGVGATSHGTRALIAAAKLAPTVAAASLDLACGTCHRQVA